MEQMPGRRRLAARVFRISLLFLFLASVLFWRGGGFLPQLQSAERPRGCPTNSRLIPGGEFLIGTTEKMALYIGKLCSRYMGFCQEEWFTVEIPRRAVYLTPFCVDTYEAPNKLLAPPITGYTWREAQAWCRARNLRLCTEEEWEKACAGAEGLHWGFGEKYRLGACNIAAEKAARAGAFAECVSAHGAHDMNGNVAEWVADEVDIATDVGKTRKMYVVKGGSSDDLPFFTRCSSREFYSGDYRSDHIGFRCCSDITR